MAEKGLARVRSTRHHRCVRSFPELLEEDSGISQFSLRQAFMGCPAASKKRAIAHCGWAIWTAGGDVERAGEALRGWAKKNGRGMYHPAITDAPPLTFGGSEATGFNLEGAHTRRPRGPSSSPALSVAA
jgi:hypothetical protein